MPVAELERPAAPSAAPQRKRPRAKAPGEPLVWISSMGLALGLLMVVVLLGVILVNGMEAFWPRQFTEVRLKENTGLGGTNILAGEITFEREKRIRGAEKIEHELQFFVGNKDANGFSFKFVDRDLIESTTKPMNVLRLERREYGPAFGVPVSLNVAGQPPVPGDAPQFKEQLDRAIDTVVDRWARIDSIEKGQIGSINASLNELAVKERRLQREHGGEVPAAQEASIRQQRQELESRYEALAAEARKLREEQTASSLVIKLPQGSERKLVLGDLLSAYYPNQLSLLGRIGLTASHMLAFLWENPREANTEGGIFPAIFGTTIMTMLLSLAVTPFGVLAAIYLREYAVQGPMVRSVRIAVNNLAGVPSIVFGVFGLGFFVYFVGGTIDQIFFKDYLPTPTFGTGGILWASLTLALMTVPVVIVATEEALAAVPRGMREGSLACGASKWQTIQRIVLPAAAPGILTGLILAMARGAGEVAPLMLVGVVKLAPNLPLDLTFPFIHLDRKFMHLGFHIYDLGFQSPDSEAAKPMVFATTLLLIVLVVVLNLSAIIIRERLRRKYATGAF